jgi:hypothetical protein
MTSDEFATQIAEVVDQRRAAISHIQRVVGAVKGTPLEQTAAIMAIPMFYAHWEGFVKEVMALYIEYVEKRRIDPSKAHPTMFSFSMKKRIRGLIANGSVESMTNFAVWIVDSVNQPLKFDERGIDTRSNLSYETLKELCDTLRIDLTKIAMDRRKLNALVHRRNNIAHTGRPMRGDDSTVADNATLTVVLIESFEAIIRECVASERFLVPA